MITYQQLINSLSTEVVEKSLKDNCLIINNIIIYQQKLLKKCRKSIANSEKVSIFAVLN